jgi:hypothetical protein
MALTREQMDRALEEHFGYEAADDIEGVLATLAPDATHDIVGWPTGPTHGRENARPFYQALFADMAESNVTCTKRLYGDNFLVDESIVESKAVGRPFGLEGKDVRANSGCSTSSSLRATGRSSAKTSGWTSRR